MIRVNIYSLPRLPETRYFTEADMLIISNETVISLGDIIYSIFNDVDVFNKLKTKEPLFSDSFSSSLHVEEYNKARSELNTKDGILFQKEEFYGYPNHHWIIVLSVRLQAWYELGGFPTQAGEHGTYNEDRHFSDYNSLNTHVVDLMRSFHKSIVSHSLNSIDTESRMLLPVEPITEILVLLKPRGILSLMGVRKTVGSVDRMIPSRSSLITMFDELNSLNSPLTVGARALCKHCIRCSSKWWGEMDGSEIRKNEKAHGILNRILNECVWINVHWLPPDIVILELRTSQDYGARWDLTNCTFRGFVEPMSDHGWDNHWFH